MSAPTSFGEGVWGIPQSQTGLILNTVSYSYVQDNNKLKDEQGGTIGITLYDERVEFTLTGTADGPFPNTIATTMTLANPLSGYLKGGVSGGSAIIFGIDQELSNEGYQSITVTGEYLPGV
jgi:hypothetical protein